MFSIILQLYQSNYKLFLLFHYTLLQYFLIDFDLVMSEHQSENLYLINYTSYNPKEFVRATHSKLKNIILT